jgi:hypothetical protein
MDPDLRRDGRGPDHLCFSNAADQMGATEDRTLGARTFPRLFRSRVDSLPQLAPTVRRGGGSGGDRGAAAGSPARFGTDSLSQSSFRNQRSKWGLRSCARRFSYRFYREAEVKKSR